MNIDLVVVGKTDSREADALVEMYAKRINFYAKFSIVYLPDVKNTRKLSQAQQRTAKARLYCVRSATATICCCSTNTAKSCAPSSSPHGCRNAWRAVCGGWYSS